MPSSAEVTGNRAPRRRERLLLVGLASCDPDEAERLIALGRMPVLAGIRKAGAWGALRPGEPLTPHALWTTIATGRHPETHGVLAPVAPRDDGGGVEPIGHAAWRAPAFWQVAEAAGRRVLTVGWPAAAPATAWSGIHVDPSFATATGPDADSWALPPRCVSPIGLRDRLRDLRLHPTEVTADMLAPIVPELARVDQHRETGLVELAVGLASAASLHAAATALIATESWDVAAIHYDLLDQAQRRFAGLAGDPIWGGVIAAAYQFADAMLGRLIALAGEDTTLVVLSPTGVRAGAIGAPRRAFGMLAARGRWIEPGTALPPARLIDIAPTVLARFGLTIETDGKVLRPLAPGASRRQVTVPPTPSPPPARHVAALRARGYDDRLSEAQAKTLEMAAVTRTLALGEALLDRGRLTEARTALLAARQRLPADSPVGLRRLARACLLSGDAVGCRAAGEGLLRAMPHEGWGDLAIAAAFALEGKAQKAWPHMARAREKNGDDPVMLARLGGVALILKEDITATDYFRRALAMDPRLLAAEHGLALARGLTEAAERGSSSV
jgi:hypothetical protein